MSISRYSRDRDETKAATRTLQLAQVPSESKDILAEISISALRQDLLYFVRLEQTLSFLSNYFLNQKKMVLFCSDGLKMFAF